MNRENAEKITEPYDKLRDECYRLARENDGELMGKDAWLRSALSPSDLTLYPFPEGIACSGQTYTMQTMSHEWFDFTIPYNLIRL